MIFFACNLGAVVENQEDNVIKEDFMLLWDYNDPTGTEERFRELLPVARISENPGYHAELLTQIARTNSLRRNFEEAHKILDETKMLLNDQYPKAEIRYLLERGRTFNSAGIKNKAIPLFLGAWNLARSSKEDSLAIDAAHMMGIAVPTSEQLSWHLKALELTESTDDEKAKKWLGPLYNNIGWTYFELKRYEEALDLFKKGVIYREKFEQIRETQIAKWSVAKTLRMMGKTERALAIQIDLKKEIKKSGVEKDGYVFEELGECYLALGNANSKASKFFAIAYEILSRDQWLVENEPGRLARLREFGKVDNLGKD